MRSFLAILLSEKIRALLVKCNRELNLTDADVKWVEEDNFHITLHFFGDIPQSTCEAVIRGMPEVTSALSPFTLSLHGINVFPNLKKPRILSAGVVRGNAEIIEVHKKVLPLIQCLGFAEEKKFHPHVTMGRVRSSTNLDKLIPAIEKVHELGDELVQGISLMESVLTPKGAQYSELAFSKFLLTTC